MPKSKKQYSEIDDIREDLNSLRTNVVELTKHMKKDGNAQALHLADSLKEQISHARDLGSAQYKNIEKRVKAKPGQTLAMAFAAGLVASMLMGRR